DLLVKADRMLMAFGVEGRVPYLDHRVVEFGLSLPDTFKVSSRRGKLLQRAWCESRLPASLVHARKQGFTVPIGEWLRSADMQWLRRSLAEHRMVRQWCRVSGVEMLYRCLHRPGRVGMRAVNAIWALLQLALWYEIFVARHGLRPDPAEPLQSWFAN
ncbi:MAG: asparagine synthetase B, partial [Gammaproteobacteria bacterium]|nr:asparagine synthetase B [Gammaproteobacteria bacterium]